MSGSLDDASSPQQDMADQQLAAQAQPQMPSAPQAPPPPTQEQLQAMADAQPVRGQVTSDKIAPDAQPIDLGLPSDDSGPTETGSGQTHGTMRSLGDAAWASTLQMGQGVLGFVDGIGRQISSDPAVSQWAEQQRRNLASHITATVDAMSPKMQQAMHASIFGDGKDVPTPGQVGWANYLGATAASLVPQVGLALLPGGIWGRAIGLVGFGASDAGEFYNSLRDTVEDAKPQDLGPTYQSLIHSGVSDQDAREQLIAKAAPAVLATHFAIGAAAGAGVGGLIRGAGAVGEGLASRAASGAAEGALTMGGASAADTAAQQYTEKQLGTRQGFDPEAMAKSFASGALGGALLGAAGGVFHGGAEEPQPEVEKPEQPAQDGVAPDQQAALQSALPNPVDEQLSLPLDHAPPGITPGQQQGELFRTPAQANPGQRALPPATQAAIAASKAASAPTPAPVPPDMQAALDQANPPANANTPSPSQGMKRQELVDALTTMPGVDPQSVRRMNLGDLRSLFDRQSQSPSTAQPENTTVVEAAPGTAPPAAVATGAAAQQPQPAPVPTVVKPEIEPAPEPTSSPAGVTSENAPEPAGARVDQAAAQAQEPKSPEQAAAGNYQKGHVRIGGLDISIETPKGGVRRGVGEDGKPWETTMPDHYGYVRGTEGYDGDHVDVTLGPHAAEAEKHQVYVIDQIDPQKRTFDEHKAFIGYPDAHSAMAAYDHSFSDSSGPSRRAAITSMPFDEFKGWLQSGKTKEPLAWKPTVGDQLRAKRAAAKARMAETGPAKKGEGYVAPESTEAEPVPTVVKEPPGLAALKRSRIAIEARQEAENQPNLFESEGAAHPEGIDTIANAPEAPELAPTTSVERTANRLLDQVLAGDKSVADAFHEMGTQPAGAGRPRKLANFKIFLEHELERAEDPKEAKKVIDEIARSQNDTEEHGNTKKARTEALQKMLERSGSEYADKIRGMLREFEDPVGEIAQAAEAKKAALLAKMKGKIAGAAPKLQMRSRFASVNSDPRLNHFLRDAMTGSEEMNQRFGLRDALNTIINHAGVRNEMRPMRALAQRLLRAAPDVPVMSPEAAHEAGLITDEKFAEHQNEHDILGEMIPDDAGRPKVILLKPDIDPRSASQHVETLLHEGMHAVTAHYIDRLWQTDRNNRDFQAIHAIGTELQNHMDASDDETFRDLDYALSDPHELHTALMTNPLVQDFAASRVASPEFRAKMAALGYPSGTRTIWQAFTGWLRRALGLGSETSDTLLDHILRPVQDITDNAIAHNRGMLPSDPALRAGAEPVMDALASSRLQRRQFIPREAVEALDPQGQNDRLRRFWLQGATTDGIVDWNRALFEPSDRLEIPGNPLEGFRAAQEAIAHASKQFHDKYADRVKALSTKLAKNPTLGKLMTDVTLADAKPAEGVGPQDILDRYNALSAGDKATYKAARDLYGEWYRTTRDAELRSLLRTAMPDTTPAQVKAFSEAARTQKSLKEFMDTPESSSIAKAFGDEWENNRALAKTLAKVHSYGFVNGDYFPLRRFGDYVVRYGSEENGDLGVEMFERRGEAEARRAELAKQGVDDLSQVMSRRESALREMLPNHPIVGELEHAMRGRKDLSGHAQSVRDLVSSLLLEHASRSQAARTRVRRRGIAGASTDGARVLAQEFINNTARIGHLEHGAERLQALSRMRMVADDLGRHGKQGEGIRASAVTNELEKRAATGDNAENVMQEVARKANVLGYAQSLMSFSHALTSSIEAHSNSTAFLGARHGIMRASLALTKALADAGPRMITTGVTNSLNAVRGELKAVDWNLAHLARDRFVARGASRANMTKLFTGLEKAGLIDHTQTQEMRRIANPSGAVRTKLGNAWQRFMDFNAAGAHAVDVMNKAAIAKAAFDLEMRRTGDTDKAVAYAIDTARKAMPNYNLGNKARIASNRGALGPWGTPIMQFKNYGLHMYSVMANLVRASVHGATREERMEARKAFAGVLATHALMAGTLTLIADPLRYVGGAYDLVTGAKAPHDYQNDVRSWIADQFGPELGQVISRGLPEAAGIDIHRRVGLANLLEVPELSSFDAKGAKDMLATALLGTSGEDAATMGGAIGKLGQGDIAGAMQDLVPRVIRDPMKAANLANRGVTDSKGKTVLSPAQIGAGSIAAQALGFQPAQVSEFREGRFAEQEALSEDRSERSQIEQHWLQAAPADRAAIMPEIIQWNQDHPGQRITISQLMRMYLQQRKSQARPGTYGLQVPLRDYQRLKQVGSFANVQ